jgi:cold shock CspA family protein
MGRSQDTWNKRETEKKKQKKRKDKEQKKEERKAQAKHGNNLDEMLAYVDENGNLTSSPPDPTKKQVIKEEDIQVSVPKQDDVPFQTVRTGRVAFFNESKGYGFIKDDETGESVFVHVNDVGEPLTERAKVTFEVEMGHKGPMAVKVKLIKD